MHQAKRRVRIIIFVFCLSQLLSACTQLAIPNSCGSWDFGVASPYPHTLEKQKNCRQLQKSKNFQSMSLEPNDEFPFSVERAENSSNQHNSPVLISKQTDTKPQEKRLANAKQFQEDAFSLDLPTGWTQAISPTHLYQYFAYNQSMDAGLFVSVYQKNPFMISSDVRESLFARIFSDSDLPKGTLSKNRTFAFHEGEAYQREMRAINVHGMNLHYFGVTIFTKNKIIYVVSWCPEDKFSMNRISFEEIVSSIKINQNEIRDQ